MCEFVSWIEYKKRVYFLDNNKLLTKEGQKLLKADVKADLCGYGAIFLFYPELKNKGIQKECKDFSTPDNFPKAIAHAIKKGQMSKIGIVEKLLNVKGLFLYEAKCAALYADYEAKYAALDADYEAKRTPMYADYEAKCAALYADYEAKYAELDADYEVKRTPMYANYEVKCAALYADYEVKRTPMYADYEVKCAALYADYEVKRTTTFWKMFSYKKYKNKKWL